MLENLTPKAKQAISIAEEEAFQSQQGQIDIQCLLVGLVQIGGLASTALASFDVNIDRLRRDKVKVGGKLLSQSGKMCSEKNDLSGELRRILSISRHIGTKLSQNHIGPEHLLLAILLDDVGAEFMTNLKVNVDSLATLVLRLNGKSNLSLAQLKQF